MYYNRTNTVSRGGSNRGFTLVELVAATALSAILTLAVLKVVASVGRDARVSINAPADGSEDLAALIRWDVVNARGFSSTENRLELEGYGTLASLEDDRSTFGSRGTVTYELAPLGGRTWLIRRETRLRPSGMGTIPSTELVYADLVKFEVRRSTVARSDETDGQLLHVLAIAADGRTVLNRTIVLR